MPGEREVYSDSPTAKRTSEHCERSANLQDSDPGKGARIARGESAGMSKSGERPHAKRVRRSAASDMPLRLRRSALPGAIREIRVRAGPRDKNSW